MLFIGQTIGWILWAFFLLMIVRLVVDWIQVFARQWQPRGILLVVLEGVYTATDPPIKAFRRVFKPVRLGGIALDLSFLMVMLLVYVLMALNNALLVNPNLQ